MYTLFMDKYQLRPKLTEHKAEIDDLMKKVNQIYDLTETEIVRLAVERFWQAANPDKPIPPHFKLFRSIRLDF
jgi:hypothetical protein